MPYPRRADLPQAVRDALPEHAQEIWRSAFNAALASYSGDEAKAAAVAWAAVKKAGYHQQGNAWVKMASPVATVTIPGVEITRAGTWAASTGVTTFSPEDLQSMVEAHRDPEVHRSPVKIGHRDPRFRSKEAQLDGSPALGWAENLRVEGDRLVGDLVGVPASLARIIPAAYRRRSIEAAWGVRTPSGRTYRCAMTGLSLLGEREPAVNGLADVIALYETAAAGELAPADSRAEVLMVEGLTTPERVTALEAARASVVALAAAAGAEVPAAMLDGLDVVAGVVTPTIPPPVPDPSENVPDATGGGPVAVDEKRIRELIGAAADADLEAEITALKAKADKAPAEPPAEGATPPATGTVPPAGSTTPPPAGTVTPPAAAPGTTPPAAGEPVTPPATVAASAPVVTVPGPDGQPVMLSAGNLGEMWAQHQRSLVAHREATLNDAIRAGKITPAERAQWATLLEGDETNTVALLSAMAPRFHVTEAGGAGVDLDVKETDWQMWEAETFGLPVPEGGK